ncbi:protein kinase [Nonomuraea sp. NPDC050328]|uniref:serine/threonine-protein kinase n=1 Tax=Nonomuraea sp. NPDC050328 TaxID=3364361 RepID=UPI0037B6340B
MDDAPGYRVLDEAGRGGFAVVYRAYQERLDRLVALKVLSVDRVDQRTMRRFQRELQLTGRLTGHPNVVTVFDTGSTRSGKPYIAMDYFENGSLRDRITRDGPFPLADVLRAGVKLAGALAAVHEAGVLHGDIKPQNILISRYGEPAIADFGVARVVDSSEISATAHAFTPLHAAPEVLSGQPHTASTDIYSLGSTLYHLLAGKPAFHSPTDPSIAPLMFRVLSNEPPPINRADVPGVVVEVVLRAMAKKPHERYGTARALAQRLQEVQAELGLPVTDLIAPDPGPATPTIPRAGSGGQGVGGPGFGGPGGQGVGGPGSGGPEVGGPGFGGPGGPGVGGSGFGGSDPFSGAAGFPVTGSPAPRPVGPSGATGPSMSSPFAPPEPFGGAPGAFGQVPGAPVDGGGPGGGVRESAHARSPEAADRWRSLDQPDTPPSTPTTQPPHSQAPQPPAPTRAAHSGSPASALPATSGPPYSAQPGHAGPQPPAQPPHSGPSASGQLPHSGPSASGQPPHSGPSASGQPTAARPSHAAGGGVPGEWAAGGPVAASAGPGGWARGGPDGRPVGSTGLPAGAPVPPGVPTLSRAAAGTAKQGGGKGKVIAGVAALVVAVVGVAVAVFVLRQADPAGTGTQATGTQAPAKEEQRATPPPVDEKALAALRPRQVKVTADQGVTVTLRWKLPAEARRYPLVIQRAPADGQQPLTPLEPGTTTARVVGLARDTGYCFLIGVPLQISEASTVAWSEPVCIRGAVPSN